MASSKVVLLSVLLSVAASVLTVALLAPKPRERAHAALQVTSPADASPAGGWLPIAAEPNAEAISQLQDKVRAIERKLSAAGGPPARTGGEVLQGLLAITQGERQLAIEDSLKELSALGNDVVPEIVAILESGRDQDYGGGFSIGGGKVQGYPRLRTVLIDALRQIGTPEAQQGLLDALRGTEDPLDYRDLFMLYGRTTEKIMVKGMSAMIPTILRNEQAKGQDQSYLLDSATAWICRHGMRETTDMLEQMTRENLAAGRPDRGTFAALVEFSPERAFALTRELYAEEGDRALWRTVGIGRRYHSLAQVARYCELVLSLEPSQNARISIYGYLPTRLCDKIESKDARVADGRVLLEFLRKRHGEETAEETKRTLAHHIAELERALQP